MPSETLQISIQSPNLREVPGRFDQPAAGSSRRDVHLLFAHGSNFGKDSPWTRTLVNELVAQGFSVLSFDYAYRALHDLNPKAEGPEQDSLELLEHVHARALAELQRRCSSARIVLAGKSLGARLSTLLAAKGERCHGLALFGYPLHAPSKARIYSEHFSAIVQPTLFLQGTHDPFCDLALLDKELPRHCGQTSLRVIKGADHGFRLAQDNSGEVPASLGELAQHTARWADEIWPL